MEHIKILNLFGTIISYFSIMIIVWGVVTSLYRFLLNEVSKADNKEKAYTRGEIRASLGSFILFGLEILIAADIIDTIARPEINEIIISGSTPTLNAIGTTIANAAAWEFTNLDIKNKTIA